VRSLGDLDGLDLDTVLGVEPSPELAAQTIDELQRLLSALRDESLRSVACWKLEGYTNAKVAARLGCIEKTVERKLHRIRQIWGEEVSS
jgi:DNA-directed RNA polymerase specialized sigma24 family protein